MMDEVVLQSPEGVSAVGPPATRSSCHPSLRAADLYPWHFSLNKRQQHIRKKIIFNFLIFEINGLKKQTFSSSSPPKGAFFSLQLPY